ncbi:MAG: hypothetical protein QOF37_1402 [Thermoleophilaceae bacterium]|nr:hypothetical protein [Thermoleophilaceae bacterium]
MTAIPAPSAANHATAARVARLAGALSLLAVGIDHIEQYNVDSYSSIPTIGTLFALNFAVAMPTALGLLVPIRRLAGRWANAALALLALNGVGIAAGSLAGLFISEGGGLFGFTEHGYRLAIVLAIVFEVGATVGLTSFLALNGLGVQRRDGRLVPR